MRDLSLHLMDIMQNSICAQASKVVVTIAADSNSGRLRIEVSDNGVGMDEEFLRRVTDPFVTTRDTRKVGIGISLFKAACERSSGDLTLTSVKGKGTTLKAELSINHIDRPTLGSIADTIGSVIAVNPGIDLELLLISSKECFRFDSCEVKEKLGDVPINEYEVVNWIGEFINEGIMNTFGGVLDEINS